VTDSSDAPRPGPLSRPSLLQRAFPEKRIFIKSGTGTRFVRLGTRHQLLAGVALTALVAWSAAATAFLVIGLVKGGGEATALRNEQSVYESRINDLAGQRDQQRMAALAMQERHETALDEIAAFQKRAFESDLRISELEQNTAALQRLLKQAMTDRDTAVARLAELDGSQASATLAEFDRRAEADQKTIAFLTDALNRAAGERDTAQSEASDSATRLAALEQELDRKADAEERIFAQLEDAVTLAMDPLDKMFRNIGLEPEKVLDEMREQYSGEGGPLTPIAYSTKGFAPTPAEIRANSVLGKMDLLALYRLAADKVPFAIPVQSAVRQTSGFGYRRDPIRGGTRLHAGLDWAGPVGTPIYASADGVIISAGSESGYGRLVRIQHEFGIETRFAHLSKISVKVGQRVSRGDLIGAMGNSGRSTGTHLHYEVRVGGNPVDPMIYIKAARDVL